MKENWTYRRGDIYLARRYGMDAYMVFKMNTGIFLAFEKDLYRGGSSF